MSREPLGLPLAPMPAVPAVLGCGVVVVVLVVVMETCQSLLGGGRGWAALGLRGLGVQRAGVTANLPLGS